MNKKEITEALSQNHQSFINYLNDLTINDFEWTREHKWSAGQQLEHIVICVKPLVKALGMDKKMLEQTFGVAAGAGKTYDELLALYVTKLNTGGKAPDRFVPQPVLSNQRETLTAGLVKLVMELNHTLERFTEQELDTLCLPHPLLGTISIREMLYNTIYHVEHHHHVAQQHLLQNTTQ